MRTVVSSAAMLRLADRLRKSYRALVGTRKCADGRDADLGSDVCIEVDSSAMPVEGFAAS